MKVHCPRLLSLAFLTLLPMAYGGTMAVGKSTPPPTTDKTPPPNPLSFAGGKVVFDVQEKVRFELRENNFDFSDAVGSPTDDSWLLQRFRLGLKWKPTDTFSFYVQGQDIRELDSDRPNVVGQMGAEGDDSFDLLQGWVELGNPKSLSLKAGRQKLSYGDERMVGALEWANQSRAFDALKLHIEQPTWTLDLFTGSVVGFVDKEFNESDIISGADRDQLFSGAYFSTSALGFQTTDAYLLHLDESSATGSTSFFTLGTRWKGLATKLNGWDYTVEGMLQAGDLKGKDLEAFAGHVDVGYNLTKASWKPRFGLEYNYASGDSDPTDGTVETFQNLFPTNHKFYGFMDLFSLQNIHNVGLNISAAPTAKLKLTADYHAFWLAETSDSWYRANGVATVRAPKSGAPSQLGTELDLTFTYKVNTNLALHGGYSHFFAGDWLGATGAQDDADFFYLQASIDF